jgi:DNA-binding NarL/FixJ family response regulator
MATVAGMHGTEPRTIRILLAEVPATLADLIAGIVADEPGLEVIGQTEGPEETHAALERLRPDVVIIRRHADECLPPRAPGVRLLAIAGDGEAGRLDQLHPFPTALGRLSARRLVQSLRTG